VILPGLWSASKPHLAYFGAFALLTLNELLKARMNETYELYHSELCGFCHRVRRYMASAGWDFPIVDTLRNRAAKAELVEGGGKGTVPCLKITRGDEVIWMYESLDIIDYLESRHQAAEAAEAGGQ
jgi:glutaredoxin